MKQNLLLMLSVFMITQISAQNFEFNISPVVTLDIASSDFEGIGHSTVINTGTVDQNLRWDKNIVEITDQWQVAVCDKNQCFPPTVNTRNFSLVPDEAGTIDVHAYPNSQDGSAIVEIVITNTDDESQNISNLYYFNQQATSTIEINRQSIKVYPNPSKGLFSVKGSKQISSVDIYSLTGVKVESFDYNDGKWYDISNLPKGTYLVRLLDRNAEQLVTKLINKF